MKKATLILIITLLAVCNAQVFAQSLCKPVLDDALLLVNLECLNDGTALKIDSTKTDAFGWQYSSDSNKDGVQGNNVGGNSFEIYGMAFKETSDQVCLAFNSNLPITGKAMSGASDGNVGWGDLFIDLDPTLNFDNSSSSKTLYAVRFSGTNDSGASSTGAYKQVSAKSVTSSNVGFSSYSQFVTHVTNKGGIPLLGDLGEPQTYFPNNKSLNVIDQGVYLGAITSIDQAGLVSLQYNPATFSGTVNFGFCFTKQLLIDECGVIGGDGSSCKDCNGTPCGGSKLDICNVCDGDGTSCLDCAGVPFGTKKLDICGVCDGDGTSCLDCEGVPFGGKKLDPCGVCGGDGTSCADCSGTPNGNKQFDACGVCDGDGTSCADCLGIPNGTAVVDKCGVCDGDDTSCLDCAGDINGTSTIDRCNICQGDGQSCLLCEDYNITESQRALDQGAKKQERLIKSVYRQISYLIADFKNSPSSKDKRYFRKTRKYIRKSKPLVHDLQVSNWTISWQMPSVASKCENSFCITLSNVPILTQYKDQSGQLHTFGKKAIKKLRRAMKQTGNLDKAALKAYTKKNNGLNTDNIALANKLPTFSSDCSN